jgi:hypothetical protein
MNKKIYNKLYYNKKRNKKIELEKLRLKLMLIQGFKLKKNCKHTYVYEEN